MCVCTDDDISWSSFGFRSISDICVRSPFNSLEALCLGLEDRDSNISISLLQSPLAHLTRPLLKTQKLEQLDSLSIS